MDKWVPTVTSILFNENNSTKLAGEILHMLLLLRTWTKKQSATNYKHEKSRERSKLTEKFKCHHSGKDSHIINIETS